MGIVLFAACAKRETTSMDITMVNNGTQNMVAKATVMQRIDDNRCQPDYANSTGAQVVNPGDSKRLVTSIECYGKVRTYFSVSYETSYSFGEVSINKAEIAAKLIPGLQFQVTNLDRSKIFTIQVVNAVPSSESANYLWSFAPGHAVQVAWLVPTGDSWDLEISLPKGMEREKLYIEFDQSLGIDKFGSYQVVYANGVYRSNLDVFRGPIISARLASGTMVCDDVGCSFKN